MKPAILEILFAVFFFIDGLAALFSIFPLLGMLTNANGFMSDPGDVRYLAAIASFPLALVLAGLLRGAGHRLAGVIVAAIPAIPALFLGWQMFGG
ncbi:putative membrane protein [Parvibaculum indicum]|uniref:hypothetical protein n=1 Tax=Parvibaculum indicum TaxID=562969 RepID=UPI00141F799C|nr:hypothetical protein [Parvibaculum indicum]NIJ42364.1 putative membrane protein [Parvibaculum indicum]